MTLITLTFAPEMEELIIQGKKCCTTRRTQLGEVGDMFVVHDRIYRICHIHHCCLYSVRGSYYDAEGFTSPAAFHDFWEQAVEQPFDEANTVFIHFFAYIGPTGHFDKCGDCPIYELDLESNCDRVYDENGYHCEVLQ
jgi:hypothetical protein